MELQRRRPQPRRGAGVRDAVVICDHVEVDCAGSRRGRAAAVRLVNMACLSQQTNLELTSGRRRWISTPRKLEVTPNPYVIDRTESIKQHLILQAF